MYWWHFLWVVAGYVIGFITCFVVLCLCAAAGLRWCDRRESDDGYSDPTP